MKKGEKKEKLKEILPLAWNSYQHMYDTRVNSTQTQINFLLIVISFLSIFSFMLFDYSKYMAFLFPIMLQFVAFVILLKSFFIKI
ncbi:hypothetical protein LCGC14_2737510 [marine sediment metagenome]|uniref:Uncharacterized protein n=1 Tax=marine sediment metagenome TaxID=412755 RepID=A0A0F8Z5F3_9ZZZZ